MDLETALAELAAERTARQREEARADRLQREVEHLTRLIERLAKHLGLPEPELDAAEVRATAEEPVPPSAPAAPSRPERLKRGRQEGHGRSALPPNLPRDVHEHRPASCAQCGGTDLRDLGQETTELLDYVASYLRVRRVIRSFRFIASRKRSPEKCVR